MRKLIFLIGSWCAIASGLLASPNLQSDSIKLLIQEYKYPRALALINDAILKDSASIDWYLLQGNILRGMYSNDKAIISYKKALGLDSMSNRVLTELALTYKSVQDYPNALTLFSKALANDSTNVVLKIECANCKFLNEQYHEANVDFMKIYLEDTTNYFAIKRLAFGLNKTNRSDSSIYFYKKAIELNPSDASNVTSLSNILIIKEKYKEGIELTENYKRIDSSNFRVNSVNAYFYLLDKQYDAAIGKFTQCVESDDTSMFVVKNLGVSYFRIDSFETAKGWLEKAYRLDTTDVLNLQFLGLACSQSYYKKLGIFYLGKALEQYDPFLKDYATIYRNLVEAHRTWSLSPCEKTLEVCLKAYQFNPNDSMLALYIALNYDECKKDYRKAIEYYNIYLKSKPGSKEPELAKHPYYAMFENRVKVLRDYLKKK